LDVVAVVFAAPRRIGRTMHLVLPPNYFILIGAVSRSNHEIPQSTNENKGRIAVNEGEKKGGRKPPRTHLIAGGDRNEIVGDDRADALAGSVRCAIRRDDFTNGAAARPQRNPSTAR
jgi:hypothetical protein